MMILSQQNDSIAVVSRLEQLGFTINILQNTVKSGHFARSTATSNHPNNSAGTFTWHESVRTLRDLLRPHGWQKQATNNKELTVNLNKTIAIDVSGGTEDTGRPDGFPQTRNTKGNQTEKLINCNQGQLFEFNTLHVDAEEIIDKFQTWVLLYYFDNRTDKKEIRFELSLPTKMEQGKIIGWSERIIFDPISTETVDISEHKPEFISDIDLEISIRNEQ